MASKAVPPAHGARDLPSRALWRKLELGRGILLPSPKLTAIAPVGGS